MIASLALLARLAAISLSQAGAAEVELPMPPPPPGMTQLEPPDDPEVAQEVEEQSAELEELRALEELALDPAAQPEAQVLSAMRRLGLGNPLRHRLRSALEEPGPGEQPPPELAPITDLATFDVSQVQAAYDIPVEMQPLVAQYIRFFQGPGRKWFRNWTNRSTRYIPMMTRILEERGLPKDTVYLAMIESGFSTRAYSWAHASGPWQFIATTGKTYNLKQDFWVDERRDPVKSTVAAARFLTRLYADLGHWYLAWAGYNAGGGRLRRVVDARGTTDFWKLIEGKGLAKETQHYVPKLIAAALVSKHLRAFGFADEEFSYQEPLAYDEVPLTQATDLEVLAKAAEISVGELQDLNPELKRWCTPPASDKAPYLLRIPQGRTAKFSEALAKVGPGERLSFRIHRVKRGDTLSAIAKAHHSAPEAIMRMNGLKSARSLKVNSELVVPIPNAAAAKAAKPDAALERQVVQARRSGFVPVRPEDEIPAGTQQKALAQGPVKTETIGGKTRITYGVQSGDSLWSIGQRFACSIEDLRSWNKLPGGRRTLKVGSLLHIFPGEKVVASRAGTVVAKAEPVKVAALKKTSHTLKAGETLWSLSRRYRVSVDDLRRWNGLKGTETLRVGQSLTVMQ